MGNLGVIIEIVSKTEMKVRNIRSREEVVVTASKEYVESMEVDFKDEELIIIEYDLDTKIVNENPTI
ncbi:hypothetical protein [uncultured Clostridium sp.]|uniref:hypothetical protein n=1 Tax=uncultured Clostridium sp. TaxID=59620 RepID=UPI00280A5029|nr:hypothetical protein [uncultured Clostridium sp.]